MRRWHFLLYVTQFGTAESKLKFKNGKWCYACPSSDIEDEEFSTFGEQPRVLPKSTKELIKDRHRRSPHMGGRFDPETAEGNSFSPLLQFYVPLPSSPTPLCELTGCVYSNEEVILYSKILYPDIFFFLEPNLIFECNARQKREGWLIRETHHVANVYFPTHNREGIVYTRCCSLNHHACQRAALEWR